MTLSFTLSQGVITTDLPAFIVGIINVTEDSFWEGSRLRTMRKKSGLEFSNDANFAVDCALDMVESGVDIIDIGAESSRPGSSYIDEEEEIARLVPIIQAIRKVSAVPISIDTRKKSVMQAAFEVGASMCNDISALQDDTSLASFVANKDLPIILMHKKGDPKTMQDKPVYEDVVEEVSSYLLERALVAQRYGVKKERIILDPGIGFGKTYEDNLMLMRNIKSLSNLGYPVMMALSRKSSIGQMTGKSVEHRLAGSLAANLLSVFQGASFVRVHDVAETRDVLAVLKEFYPDGVF